METSTLRETPPVVLGRRRFSWDGNLLLLLAVAAGAVVLWQLPWGREALWPFTLLATWYHEMGHAMAAMLLGGDLVSLKIFPDGSGLATYEGAIAGGRVGRALVAASGPVAPSVAGGVMIVCSRNKEATGWCLFGLGALLIVSAVLWVDWWESFLGAAAILALGAAALVVAVLGGNGLRTVTLQLCGVQACIALWRDWSYFFAAQATVGGAVQHSDAGAIAQALWLPTWFWGACLTAFSLAALLISLTLAFRRRPTE